MKLKVLDLFSGIGGFSLGLERAGMKTIAFCELDEKCQLVLKKHWPTVPIYNDITKLNYEILKKDGFKKINVICGGFPCQDISCAGKQAGITGKRSGLWTEFARLIDEIKPDYAIIENVANLRSKGLVTVLQDLREIGYDAEWHIIPAWAVGALHRRERIWIVAYPTRAIEYEYCIQPSEFNNGCKTVVYSNIERLKTTRFEQYREFWSVEPEVGRVVDGFPGRVDRIKQLGNSVVPQIPELIGRAIMEMRR
jgi:DNA (cytosine-5)-methyltransferase 1